MKTVFFLILFFLFSAQVHSQQISFEDVSSENVLQYLQNVATSQTSSSSVTHIQQYGNNNLVEVLDRSNEFLSITQIGDQNSTLLTNPNLYPTNAEIRINGSGNNIDIQGSNSISYGMIMNINANDTTIIMRNH